VITTPVHNAEGLPGVQAKFIVAASRQRIWYAFSSGINGIQYVASFAQGGRIRAEAYIVITVTKTKTRRCLIRL
jgi:hypothetical protein